MGTNELRNMVTDSCLLGKKPAVFQLPGRSECV